MFLARYEIIRSMRCEIVSEQFFLLEDVWFSSHRLEYVRIEEFALYIIRNVLQSINLVFWVEYELS